MKKKCVIYARLSSWEQKEHGYSTEAQIALLKNYAHKNGFEIVEIFEDVETAKKAGRKNFSSMLKYLKKYKSVNILLVEKNDRLYRNFRDYVTIDEFKALQGECPAKAPYGYYRENSKTIKIDTKTAPLVIRAYNLYAEGNLSLQGLCEKLHDEGFIYSDSRPKVYPSVLEKSSKALFT